MRSGSDRVVIDNVVVRLEADYYVLREGGRVRFADGLLKDWWSRNGTTPVGSK